MGQLACWTTLILLGSAFAMAERPVWGAEGQVPVKKVLRKKGRRLPAHFASGVNEKQREEIYKIQEEYQPKIDALYAQIKALKKERDDKIAAVLTAEQKAAADKAAADKAKAKADKKAETTAPAAPPVETKPAK